MYIIIIIIIIIYEWNEWHPAYTLEAFTRWRHPSEVAHIRLQLTTHLSTSKEWKAELAKSADLVADGLPT